MKKLIDERKYLAVLKASRSAMHDNVCEYGHEVIHMDPLKEILSKHTKDIVDEPQHPSGMDREDINVRNALRKELREE